MTDPKKNKEVPKQEEEDNMPEGKDKKADPHRGTTDTPSQHKALDPEGERNNDEEDYDTAHKERDEQKGHKKEKKQ